MSDGKRCVGILLYQKDGDAFSIEVLDDIKGFFDKEGRKPHRGFIHDQHLRPGQQGPGHGQHLLLTSAEGSPGLVSSIEENGKLIQDFINILLDGFAILPGIGTHEEIFMDGEIGEDSPPFENG